MLEQFELGALYWRKRYVDSCGSHADDRFGDRSDRFSVHPRDQNLARIRYVYRGARSVDGGSDGREFGGDEHLDVHLFGVCCFLLRRIVCRESAQLGAHRSLIYTPRTAFFLKALSSKKEVLRIGKFLVRVVLGGCYPPHNK